jgi:DNA-directed RNA polymerase alpha subunit
MMSQEAERAISEAVRNKHPVSNLEQLGVGQRMINLLHDNRIYDMEDLLNKRKEDLLSLPNFGEKQLEKIMAALCNYHLVDE